MEQRHDDRDSRDGEQSDLDVDDVMSVLTDAAQRGRDEPTLRDLQADVEALREEVARLRAHIAAHDQALAGLGDTAKKTPDQRAIALRFYMLHRANAHETTELALDWHGVDDALDADLFRQQAYEAMYRAARGESYTHDTKCSLDVVPGFELRNTGDAGDPLEIVCQPAHVPQHETFARLQR